MDSLSSADKQGGNYTFDKLVSAQEFGEDIATQTIHIDNDENAMAYKKNKLIRVKMDCYGCINVFLSKFGCDFSILTSAFKNMQAYPLSMPINIKVD